MDVFTEGSDKPDLVGEVTSASCSNWENFINSREKFVNIIPLAYTMDGWLN